MFFSVVTRPFLCFWVFNIIQVRKVHLIGVKGIRLLWVQQMVSHIFMRPVKDGLFIEISRLIIFFLLRTLSLRYFPSFKIQWIHHMRCLKPRVVKDFARIQSLKNRYSAFVYFMIQRNHETELRRQKTKRLHFFVEC